MEKNLELIFRNNFLNDKFNSAAFAINFMLATGKDINTYFISNKELKDLIYKVILANLHLPYFSNIRLRSLKYDEFCGENAIDNLCILLKSNIYYSFKKKDIIEILSSFNIKTIDIDSSKILEEMIEINNDDIAFISLFPNRHNEYFSIESLEIENNITLTLSKNLETYKVIRKIINSIKIS